MHVAANFSMVLWGTSTMTSYWRGGRNTSSVFFNVPHPVKFRLLGIKWLVTISYGCGLLHEEKSTPLLMYSNGVTVSLQSCECIWNALRWLFRKNQKLLWERHIIARNFPYCTEEKSLKNVQCKMESASAASLILFLLILDDVLHGILFGGYWGLQWTIRSFFEHLD